MAKVNYSRIGNLVFGMFSVSLTIMGFHYGEKVHRLAKEQAALQFRSVQEQSFVLKKGWDVNQCGDRADVAGILDCSDILLAQIDNTKQLRASIDAAIKKH